MRSAASFLYMILIDLVLFPTTAFILQDCFHKSKGGGIKFANTNLKKTDFATSASDIPDREVTNLDDFYTDDRNTTISALPRLNWNAAVISSVRVQERDRTCEEYMRLPASEYSVLSAEQIIRLSVSEFRCTLPTMNFFGTKIQPILYVDVSVYPEYNRSEITVLRAETVGSETALRVNGTFNINAKNIVSAGIDKKGRKTLNSDTRLMVNVEVPPSGFPLRVIQTGGNFILQASLDIIVPTFLRVLSADFHRWSEGNDSRGAIEDSAFSSV